MTFEYAILTACTYTCLSLFHGGTVEICMFWCLIRLWCRILLHGLLLRLAFLVTNTNTSDHENTSTLKWILLSLLKDTWTELSILRDHSCWTFWIHTGEDFNMGPWASNLIWCNFLTVETFPKPDPHMAWQHLVVVQLQSQDMWQLGDCIDLAEP